MSKLSGPEVVALIRHHCDDISAFNRTSWATPTRSELLAQVDRLKALVRQIPREYLNGN